MYVYMYYETSGFAKDPSNFIKYHLCLSMVFRMRKDQDNFLCSLQLHKFVLKDATKGQLVRLNSLIVNSSNVNIV